MNVSEIDIIELKAKLENNLSRQPFETITTQKNQNIRSNSKSNTNYFGMKTSTVYVFKSTHAFCNSPAVGPD